MQTRPEEGTGHGRVTQTVPRASPLGLLLPLAKSPGPECCPDTPVHPGPEAPASSSGPAPRLPNHWEPHYLAHSCLTLLEGARLGLERDCDLPS